MRRHKNIQLIPAFLLLIPSLLQAQEPVARLKNHPFQESYQDQVPVSGRVIAGIILSGPVATARLALIPPESAAGTSVCVQVMSRDGRYWAKNTFDLPPRIGATPVALEYPSQHQDFLLAVAPDQLAVLGSAGECDSIDRDTLFLSSVPTDTAEDIRVKVLVNSGRSDTYIAITNDAGKRRPTRCQAIEDGRRTGYDTLCSIRLSELDPALDHLRIKIIRRRYERMLPPTEFSVELPHLNK